MLKGVSNIYGGLSGKINKYFTLSNIYTIKKKLNKNIKIMGCGGIETIEDVKDYLNIGADFVQLGSLFYDSAINKLDVDKINNLVDKFNDLQTINNY
jgi:dihydroorotate dehydrogenase (fumarate)